jgi:hypothetical protein
LRRAFSLRINDRLLVFSVVLILAWAKSVSAATGDVPLTVVKGAQITAIFHGAGGVVPEVFEVEEIRGQWVRVKAVKTEIWQAGYEGVWLSLDAIDQIAIAPPAPALAK